MLALCVGFVLDLIIGDPYNLPHPVRWIGSLISAVEHRMYKDHMPDAEKKKAGVWLVLIVCMVTLLCSGLLLVCAYMVHPYLGMAIEAIMTFQILATKSLKVESMKVYKALHEDGIQAARKAVSMIVGRDTEALDETGVAKAAIETVAENTSDGVIAPMIYLALGGPVLGMVYKAINTMDSMVGYKNDRYLYYGRAAAKLDDIVNYIPARISALIMVVAAGLMPGASGKNAWKIYVRDRYNHASPNSAQTESACAGALGIRLAGNAYYFGKLYEKPYIGDATRDVEVEDIRKVNRLMYITAFLALILCEGLIFLVWFLCK